MDVSTLIPALALFTLLSGLGVGVYRLMRLRAKQSRGEQ